MQLKERATQMIAIQTDALCVHYDSKLALSHIQLAIQRNQITALIGPSGCGKSTFLRALNRTNDLIPNTRSEGDIWIDDENLMSPKLDTVELRKKVGMVFQHAAPFPFSIYENIAYGPRLQGVKNKRILDKVVETSLHSAALWDEVKDHLYAPATSLSGGQQQRLTIARALAIEPTILLMDEPTSALDPISTAVIEQLILTLKKKYTIVIVTHNMQQAARISDKVAFFLNGEVKEYGSTDMMFNHPREPETRAYISGEFG